MVDVTRGLDAAQEAFADAERGVPNIGFAEVYFQTAYDPTVAPDGKHLVSVFAQYAPYALAEGTWDSRRDEIGRQILDAIGRVRPRHARLRRRVRGPRPARHRAADRPHRRPHLPGRDACPTRCGSTASPPRTPVPGLYLCGAATHPAGSVIALNGRNAAMAVLDRHHRGLTVSGRPG